MRQAIANAVARRPPTYAARHLQTLVSIVETLAMWPTEQSLALLSDIASAAVLAVKTAARHPRSGRVASPLLSHKPLENLAIALEKANSTPESIAAVIDLAEGVELGTIGSTRSSL